MPGRREGVGVLLPIDGEGIPIGYILVGVYRPTCLRGTTNDGRVRVLLSLASGSNFDFSNSIFLILERILEILERWGSKSFFLIFRCCKCFFLITALLSASFLRRIFLSNKMNLTPTRNFDAAWRHLARVRLTQLGTANSNNTMITPSKPFRCLPTGRCLRFECKSISRKIRDHRITTTKYTTFIHNSVDVKTIGRVPLAAISWK